MKARTRVVGLGLAVAMACLQAAAMGQEKGYSHVRVVRLSFVDGTVLLKRPGAADWVKASVNTPIEEGFALSTGENSFAEVEFENGSTARIGQLSELNFTQLAVDPSGSKINNMTLDRGYGTFKVSPQKHERDVYTVKVGAATLTPDGKAEFRTDFKDGRLRVEVFDGSVRVGDGAEEAKLSKNKVLEIGGGEQVAFNVTNGIDKDDWDNWVHARDVQTELAFNDSPVGATGPLAGWADLDEYGTWGYFPGYGYAWSPFVAAGWSPFSMGQWSMYPGLGYTWISAEPWGWLPFHYGGWAFSSMYGYLWQPGLMNVFNPGMVAWFSGPGYVGWSPLSLTGAMACPASFPGCVTSVTPATFAGGGVVSTANRVPTNLVGLNRVPRPPILAGAAAMLPGQASPAVAVRAGVNVTAPGTSFAARSGGAVRAPRIVLMGQTLAQGSKMETVDNAHRSAFSRAFGSSGSSTVPMTVRMGNTVGGRYPIAQMRASAAFEARGGMNGGFARQSPVFLRGNAEMRSGGPQLRMGGSGRIEQVRSSSPSYGGGYRGGMSGASSARSAAPASAPAMSAPAASSHAAAASSSARR